MPRRLFGLLAAAVLALAVAPALAQDGTKLYGVTLGDALKYPAGFQHFDYVNPDAPKGGSVVMSSIGSFDTFNPFNSRGDAAPGIGLLFEALTTTPEDDPLAQYGLIAESMEIAPDRASMIFNLRPEAKWQDGQPITADDVVWTFDTLKEKGAPNYRYYYGDVVKAEALDPHRVKFTFKDGNNRELPVIMAQLVVLPKHYWEGKAFDEPTLTPPLGSGPYKVESFEPGRSVTYKRLDDYWGNNLPVNRGINNYGTIRYDLYRDPTVALEAFKGGAIDLWVEASAKNWATAYDIPAVKDGRIIKQKFPDANPDGMQCYAFNLRRPIFSDPRVREAIGYAFDFEWSNKTLFFGDYARTRSFYQNSEMEAKGLPSDEELKILEPFRGKIPDEVFTTEYNPPVTDGSGNNRAQLEQAAKLLDAAGWTVVNGVRMKDGQPLSFEFLLDNPLFERITEPMIRNLAKIGIQATMRTVDSAQYVERLRKFDFDIVVATFAQSLSPGNEQRDFWGSAAADQPDSYNILGIKNPVIDQLVEELIAAPTRHDLIIHARALDRVLQWSHYVVPQYHFSFTRIAFWDKFGRPEKLPDPPYGTGSSAWWVDPAKAAQLAAKKQAAATVPSQPSGGQATPATPAGATPPEADRGRSPIVTGLYGLGIVVLLLVAFALGRRGRK